MSDNENVGSKVLPFDSQGENEAYYQGMTWGKESGITDLNIMIQHAETVVPSYYSEDESNSFVIGAIASLAD